MRRELHRNGRASSVTAGCEANGVTAHHMTFSIVAWCPRGQQLGVGVATRHLAVGGAVPHVAGGVGAVATQAETNPLHGVRGVTLMSSPAALTAEQAMRVLRASDEEGRAAAETRQVHGVDVRGGAGGWTGDACVPWAGCRAYPASEPGGECFSVAGNMLAGPDVIKRMAEAFLASGSQPLPERLLLALEAGDAAGGDKRGRMSAAIKVSSHGQPYCSVDLRVDHHAEPLPELRRLLDERRKEWAASFYDTRPRARL